MSDQITQPTRIFRDERFLAHDPGPGHVESPFRLEAIYKDLDANPPTGAEMVQPRIATQAEIFAVHDSNYFRQVEDTRGLDHVALDPDTSTSPGSYEAAMMAAGAVLHATESTFDGSSDGAFALVRPPGHHAEKQTAMGFCIFNNVAVAAEHAIRELGCKRVAILDPDVHHGNGTQNSFYDRSDVLYVSSHRYPFYPGTGWFDETGIGDGEGFTVNLPMPAQLGDAEFFYLYDQTVGPIIDEYEPDLLIVSAGYDTWQRDPLGMMRMTGEGYRALFGLFKQWSDRHCPGRLVLALEGGYDPEGLVVGVRSSLDVLTGAVDLPEGIDAGVSESALGIARNARSALGSKWRSVGT